MGISWARDRRLNQALLASLALHLAIALLIPAAVVLSGATSSIETISFVRITHAQIARPQPVVRAVRAVAPAAGPIVHVTSKVVAPSKHPGVAHVANTKTALNSAPTVGARSQAGSTTAQAGANAATATAAPQAAAPSVAPQQNGGYMPLGAEDPTPVLDPSARTALEALKIHVTLVITVDANGRTKHIDFQPPLDAATEARVSALLADARWDPAICGAGVPCEAPATITL